jgi:hypothetical protein
VTTPTIPRRAMRLDIEEHAREWLRSGRPPAMEFVGWKDSRGNRIATAEEVWARWGPELLAQVGPDGCAHALQVLGRPRRRLQRAV